MLLENFLSLQKHLDELFNRELFPGTTFSRRSFPSMNLFEKDDALILKAELPGFEKEDLKIEIKENSLLLSGIKKERETDDRNYHRRERLFGTFTRQFGLPYRVNTEKVLATLLDGILTIEMEKAESAKVRSIAIK
ncbi:MAG: Hsp20/alpha crystallin family protein [Oligoflexia bacterium]|nr:Hsp20/alpha crystallin family protein [Oligoflexia bacterium]